MAVKKAVAPLPPAAVNLKRIRRETIHVPIVGTTPLIVHAWDQKAKLAMLEAQQGKKAPKEFRDPDAEYEASLYRLNDGTYGFPVVGFKAAVVMGGGRMFGKSVKMTELRIAMNFLGDGIATEGTLCLRIDGEPTRRDDIVKINMGVATNRFRAEFLEWSAVLHIDYIPHMISVDSILALVDAGGANGVGEWRPERDGLYGTFQVAEL